MASARRVVILVLPKYGQADLKRATEESLSNISSERGTELLRGRLDDRHGGEQGPSKNRTTVALISEKSAPQHISHWPITVVQIPKRQETRLVQVSNKSIFFLSSGDD